MKSLTTTNNEKALTAINKITKDKIYIMEMERGNKLWDVMMARPNNEKMTIWRQNMKLIHEGNRDFEEVYEQL